jgi:ribosomal protein S18 acetylase RimI-like enzyme
MIEIRPATTADIKEVATLVAELNARESDHKTREANLEFVGVDQQARGRGYASALLTHAIHWIFSHKSIREIDLSVYKSNPAFNLYQRLGFEPLHLIFPYEGAFRLILSD